MTRRAILALAPLAPAIGGSRPLVRWSAIVNENSVGIEGASAALTSHGVLVGVVGGTHATEWYAVTLRYQAGENAPAQQTKALPRDRTAVTEGWTECVFWTGQPVVVLEVRVRELACCGETIAE